MSTKPYTRISLSNRLSHRLTPDQRKIIDSVQNSERNAREKTTLEQVKGEAKETPPSIKKPDPSLRFESLKLSENKKQTLKSVREEEERRREEEERRQSEIREKVGRFFFNATRREVYGGGYKRKSKKSKSKKSRKHTKR